MIGEICAAPFRHCVIDGFASQEALHRVNEEWPEGWHKEDAKHAVKWHRSFLPPAASKIADSVSIEQVEELSGVRGLIADPDLFGAGLHCIPRGGFLKMHVDFNRHPRGWHRRVNVLIYLNRTWQEDWGGHLQLGLGAEAKRIAPIGGRCVIFETNDESWHGHPEPLNCPEGVQRRSLALYFYTKRPPTTKAHTTIYR